MTIEQIELEIQNFLIEFKAAFPESTDKQLELQAGMKRSILINQMLLEQAKAKREEDQSYQEFLERKRLRATTIDGKAPKAGNTGRRSHENLAASKKK